MSDGDLPAFQFPETSPIPSGPAPPTGQELLYAAFMAGICSGALSGVPLINSCCCLWMVGGGMLAVYFFQLKAGRPLPGLADGGRLGLLTGFFAFFVAFFTNLFSQVLIHRGVQRIIARYREEIQKSMAANPQAREALDWALTPGGMAALFIIFTMILFVAFVSLSAVGGVLGVKAMRRRGAAPGG